MNVLCIDTENQMLDFVLRCTEADHSVRWWMDAKDDRAGEGFNGFIKINEWRSSMGWARNGLIITSGNCKFMREFDRFRELGFKIFGPTYRSAQLEIERGVGMEAMQAAGIEVPHYETFDSLEAASKFARKSDTCYVFKPLGSHDDKSLTFVSCDPAEMVGWIDRQIKRGMKLNGQCMLQEKIDMCCEIGIAGWFGPQGFLPGKYEISFEHKKLCNDEKGPNTGEMVSVCKRVETDPLVSELLLPFENYLLKAGHTGDFCVGAMIDKKGKAWPLETTVRCGWPAFFVQMACVKGDPVKWMRDLLDGEDTLKMKTDVAIGVVMAQPKFPYNCSKPEDVEGNPIAGLDDEDDAFHPIGVMLGRGPKMVDGNVTDAIIPQTTGEYVVCVTGLGETVSDAKKTVYKSVDKIKFPDAIFRTDGGDKVIKALPKLHEFGYALEIEP
jgi:phosphoribosylamine--glycine ligase